MLSEVPLTQECEQGSRPGPTMLLARDPEGHQFCNLCANRPKVGQLLSGEEGKKLPDELTHLWQPGSLVFS